MPASRLEQLQRMAEREPNDAFIWYGLALEYKKAGQGAQAIAHLDHVIQLDPLYCYAYFQKGQVLESQDKHEDARKVYQSGIAAATRKGDEHARSELAGALDLLP